MKNLLLIVLIAFVKSATGQGHAGQSRQMIIPTALQEFRQVTRAALVAGGVPLMKSVKKSARFTIVGDDPTGNNYIIYFWNWNTGDPNYASLNFNAANNEQRFFLLPKGLVDVVSRVLYKKWAPTVGALNFPFKYRPQNGKFEKTFSLSVVGGFQLDPLRNNQHTFSLLLGVGGSSVTLNKYNTDPSAALTESTDHAAVTLSLSFMYQWERLQVGLSAGVDNLLDNEVTKWKYQSKPWFSLGVGIAIFSKNEVSTPGSN